MKYVSGRLRKLELGLSSHSETKQTLNVIGNVDITGIASASAFADFDYLQAPYGSTVSFTVTVASKSNHRYSGGSSNAYYINGIESPVLTLTPGRTYRFNNNNSGSHPLRFYYDADRTIQYSTGVNFQNTYTEITVSDTTPNVLHYQCANHPLMGNSVVTNSNVVDSPYAATLRDSLTVSGNITANGNILGDNATNISGINSVTATSFFGDGSGLVNVVIPGISTAGTTELTNLDLSGHLKVSGISTFGNDKVIVGGATTDLLVNGSARVTGELKVGDGTITLNSAGLSTFPTGVDVSGGSGLIASSAKISDLTSGRIVFAGTGGELEDSANLTFDGATLTGAFSGDGSGLTGVSIPGINTSGTTELTNLDLSGTLKVAGVSTFSGNINANGNIVGDNSTNITGIAGVTATTLAGTLQTAAQPNITSLGTLSSLTVSGVIDANGSLDVDGHTELDDVNVSGVSTFTGAIDANGSLDVDGHTELDDVNVSGASTFATAKVTDLTDDRIVIAGTGGELEDSSKLTFDGTTLAIVGDATFTGNVSVAGTLTSEDKTNVDSLGIVTARTGVRITSGGLVVSSGVATFTDAIDSNGGTNIAGGLVADTAKVSDLTNGRVVYAGASGELQDSSNLTFNGTTLTGTFGGDGTALLVTIPGISTTTTSEFTNLSVVGVLTAGSAILGSVRVSDLTSGRVVYAGNSGEIQDNSTFTFNGSTVTAPAFAGDGSALTGITAGGVGAIGGLTVKDEGVVVGTAGSIATLDFLGGGVSVTATSGAAGIATVTVATVQNPDVQTLNVSGVSTFGGNINANGSLDVDGHTELDNLNVTGVSTFNANVLLGDSGVFGLGAAGFNGGVPDLRFYHNGSSSNIANNTGHFYISQNASNRNIYLRAPIIQIQDGNSNSIIETATSGGITVKHNNSTKLETLATGIRVTGTVIATGADVNGDLDVSGVSTFTGAVNADGNISITNTSPKLFLTDSDNNSDFSVRNSDGNFIIYDETNAQQRMVLASDGTFDFNGNVDLNNGLDVTSGDLNVAGNAGIGSLNVTGVSTFAGGAYFTAQDNYFKHDNSTIRFQRSSSATQQGAIIVGNSNFDIFTHSGGSGGFRVYTGGSYKLTLDSSGTLSATTFSGSGASLTSITNSNLSGSAGITNANLANSTVSYGGISLSLGGSDATPAFNLTDATNYPTSSLVGTITNAQLAGSIANNKLTNSTVSYGGVSLALGETDATPAFNLTDATNYPFTSLTGITTTILGDATPKLGGDLNGNGKSIFNVGIITATLFDGPSQIGIQSGGTQIGVGITQLNFVGTGNTFAVNGTTVDVSIAGGSGGSGGGGGGDKFNTGITNSVQATIYGYESDIISFPSDNTKRYVIESISVGNVTTGVGTTVNVIASINPGVTTYSSEYKVYLAYNVPVPDNGLVELLKEPMVVNPSDVLKVWATDENNIGVNGAIELYASYTEHESTDFIAGYGSTTNITTTGIATVYTSTSDPTVIQSIKATNRTDTGDFPITIQIVNGSTVTHLAKNLVIPRYASVELLDRPKRIEAGAEIRMQQAAAANTIDVIVSGKKITS